MGRINERANEIMEVRMKSEKKFEEELFGKTIKVKEKKKKLVKVKVLQEPKVSEVARLRASIAAERNANVKTKRSS